MKGKPGDRVFHTYKDKEYLGTIQNTSDDSNIAAVSLPGEGKVINIMNDFSFVYDGIDNLSIELVEGSSIQMDVQNRTLIIETE